MSRREWRLKQRQERGRTRARASVAPARPAGGIAKDGEERALLVRLLDIAHDASTYLRFSPNGAVRVSSALLLAASLAACSEGEPSEPPSGEAVVQPLTQEVRSGLPTKPGKYPVDRESVSRDDKGVYRFSYSEPGQQEKKRASTSLLRFLSANEDTVEIPAQGDPILRLQKETPVWLTAADADRTTVIYRTGMPGVSPWYPFFYISNPFPQPVYYDPPQRAGLRSGEPVRDSVVSNTAKPPAQRTLGAPGAVSGRAGGTGSGTAVSGRTGSLGGKSASVSSPKSSGFSGGSGSSASGASS